MPLDRELWRQAEHLELPADPIIEQQIRLSGACEIPHADLQR
jgi:hypothetical protein